MSVLRFPAFAVVLFSVHLLAPPQAPGQRLSSGLQFTSANMETQARAASRSLPDLTLTSVPAEFVPTSLPYTLRVDTTRSLKRRITPYAIGGAIVGGVAGLALMPGACDVGDNMFCQYTQFGYPLVGVGVGTWLGILTGYLRER